MRHYEVVIEEVVVNKVAINEVAVNDMGIDAFLFPLRLSPGFRP